MQSAARDLVAYEADYRDQERSTFILTTSPATPGRANFKRAALRRNALFPKSDPIFGLFRCLTIPLCTGLCGFFDA